MAQAGIGAGLGAKISSKLGLSGLRLTGRPVAVIGETAERVDAFAKELAKLGLRVKTYRPSQVGMSFDDLMIENRAWINSMKSRGVPIYDIGRDPLKVAYGRPMGEFYKMELSEMQGYFNWIPLY